MGIGVPSDDDLSLEAIISPEQALENKLGALLLRLGFQNYSQFSQLDGRFQSQWSIEELRAFTGEFDTLLEPEYTRLEDQQGASRLELIGNIWKARIFLRIRRENQKLFGVLIEMLGADPVLDYLGGNYQSSNPNPSDETGALEIAFYAVGDNELGTELLSIRDAYLAL